MSTHFGETHNVIPIWERLTMSNPYGRDSQCQTHMGATNTHLFKNYALQLTSSLHDTFDYWVTLAEKIMRLLSHRIYVNENNPLPKDHFLSQWRDHFQQNTTSGRSGENTSNKIPILVLRRETTCHQKQMLSHMKHHFPKKTTFFRVVAPTSLTMFNIIMLIQFYYNYANISYFQILFAATKQNARSYI